MILFKVTSTEVTETHKTMEINVPGNSFCPWAT